MLRIAEWKYVHRHFDGPDELYHLAQDPRNTRNLVDDPKHEEIRKSMLARLDNGIEQYVRDDLDGSKFNDRRGKFRSIF